MHRLPGGLPVERALFLGMRGSMANAWGFACWVMLHNCKCLGVCLVGDLQGLQNLRFWIFKCVDIVLMIRYYTRVRGENAPAQHAGASRNRGRGFLPRIGLYCRDHLSPTQHAASYPDMVPSTSSPERIFGIVSDCVRRVWGSCHAFVRRAGTR